MNRRKGREVPKQPNQELVSYKNLERNVLEEISKEFVDNNKQKPKGNK